MICLERDAKELGLGFGGGREMEDTELEEGEACSYHNNNDYGYDASVDPDVALSYIDEKLQDVLGHFQKDFEGGVSAENLGAKFGGYGSFLPTYQRSPAWSHPKTPPKTQQNNVSRSPNNFQMEGGRRSSLSSSTASQSLRPESASATAVSLPVSKAPSSLIASGKQELCMPSHFSQEAAPKYESAKKKTSSLPDQKMLKVRIKMGSDNLSTQNNAAIYSGLGLDISPSSSLDESPSESEGMSHEPQDTPFESPDDILRIMTSFPVHGGLILSPLPDDLIHLTEKEKLPKDSGSFPVQRVGPESSGIICNGSDSIKGERKVSGENNIKFLERNEITIESRTENNKDSCNGVDVISKEYENLDTLACDDLVSDTLKLPLLSNPNPALGDVGKVMSRGPNISKEVIKGVVKDKGLSDLTKEEHIMPTFMQEDGWVENPKSSSAGKVWEDKKASSVDSDSLHPRKDGHRKGEKPLVKTDSRVSSGKKGFSSELTDLPKDKANQKATSHEQEGLKLNPGRESSSSEGKKKKGSQVKVKVAAEMPKENSRAGSSSISKNMKTTYVDNYTAQRELQDFKSQKNIGKAKDMYKDFFGDIELEQENQMSPSEMSCEDRFKDNLDVIGKNTHETNNVSREKSSIKKIDKQSTSEAYPKAASSAPPPPLVNGSILDTAPVAPAPVVTQENWVCCDKCQKWRLLPLGKNPNDLPEKWLCSMLNWLPGKNRCSFSEEETTNALRALYQAPAPEMAHVNLQNNIDGNGVVYKPPVDDARQHDQNQESFGLHTMSISGKKKHGLKESSNTHSKDGTTHLLNSVKKITEASTTNGSLSDVKRSPMVNEPDFLKTNKSSDTAVEKNKHKKKEKHRVSDSRSGGDTKKSKMKAKKDLDQEFTRVSKKSRTDVLPENLMSDHAGTTAKAVAGLTDGLPAMSSGKSLPNYINGTLSKDSKHGRKDRAQISTKKPKDKVQVSLDGSMDVEKQTNGDVSKKRKVRESLDAQPYPGSLSSTGHGVHDRNLAKEEYSENDYRKGKKTRVSRFDEKESSTSKGTGRTDKKGSHKKSQQLGQDVGSALSQRSLDGVESLKRDSGSLHPAAAATSSSSKVSGSHKSKANFPDAKGSPVESVSSSPMRVLKPEKLTSARRNVTEKDDSPEPGIFGLAGLRRCSDGEVDGGSDRSGTARKDKTLDAAHHGSFESSILDFHEKDNQVSGGKAKMRIVPSPDLTNRHFANGTTDCMGQDTRYPSKSTTLDQCHDGERQNNHHPHHANASTSKKSGKGSSSRSKDKRKDFCSEFDNGLVKVSDSTIEQALGSEPKPVDGKSRSHEKFGVKSDESENIHVTKKDSRRMLPSENGKRESNSNFGVQSAPDVKVDANCGQDATTNGKQSVLLDCETVPKREKSHSLPIGGAQNDTINQCPQPVADSCRASALTSVAVSASNGDNALKVQKKSREVDHPNGIHHSTSKNPSSSVHRVKDLDAPSPVKRDSTSQATNNAVKEAKSLKHLADRLKNSGSMESTRLYFEAVLKFLYAASLLESSGIENAKTGEMIQSMQMYSSTAKLCEFCAHEYEKSKDMAAAALAYKCMEVAYMRVIYSSHSSANRDRHELQTALQMIPPGESPSSSASDVDNLNHPTTVDKVPLAKGISSPQVTGNHIIAARNRPNFVRLLSFAQDVNFAMEASRKSRVAFAAANVSLGEAQRGETILSVKTALDYNFQDVDGLLRLVKLAIEAINR